MISGESRLAGATSFRFGNCVKGDPSGAYRMSVVAMLPYK